MLANLRDSNYNQWMIGTGHSIESGLPLSQGMPDIPVSTERIRIEGEAQTLIATPIRGTQDVSPQARAHSGRDSVTSSPRRQWTSQLGRYDPREQRVLGFDGGGIPQLWGIPYPLHIQWKKEPRRMGRPHPDRPKLNCNSLQNLEFRHPFPGERC